MATGLTSLGLVVVNFRSHELLRRNLGRLDLAGLDVTVVVVDNRSTEAERVAVSELAAQQGWQLVALEENAGFGAGVNAGVRRAVELGCGALLLLNPDALADRSAVVALHEQVVADPDAVVAPRIVDSDGGEYFAGAWLDMASGRTVGRAAAPSPTLRPWLTAACLALSADVWQRAGGFDPRYFMYWEDVDFSFRASAAGGRLVVRSDVTVVHDEGGSQLAARQRAKSALYYRFNCRNRLVFGAVHLDRRSLVRWIVRTPAESWQIVLRGGRRQLLTAPGASLLPTVLGSVAGLLAAARALLVARQEGRRRNSIARR